MYTHTTHSPFMSYMVKISGPNRSAKIIAGPLYVHFRKYHLLHNLHTDLHREKQGEDWRNTYANTYEI